jgi:hypothetical protein
VTNPAIYLPASNQQQQLGQFALSKPALLGGEHQQKYQINPL